MWNTASSVYILFAVLCARGKKVTMSILHQEACAFSCLVPIHLVEYLRPFCPPPCHALDHLYLLWPFVPRGLVQLLFLVLFSVLLVRVRSSWPLLHAVVHHVGDVISAQMRVLCSQPALSCGAFRQAPRHLRAHQASSSCAQQLPPGHACCPTSSAAAALRSRAAARTVACVSCSLLLTCGFT